MASKWLAKYEIRGKYRQSDGNCCHHVPGNSDCGGGMRWSVGVILHILFLLASEVCHDNRRYRRHMRSHYCHMCHRMWLISLGNVVAC